MEKRALFVRINEKAVERSIRTFKSLALVAVVFLLAFTGHYIFPAGYEKTGVYLGTFVGFCLFAAVMFPDD